MAQITTKRMFLPIVDETYEEHFQNNLITPLEGVVYGILAPLTYGKSWASPQDQVDEGYPIFIQPSNATALYEHTHDLGVLITEGVIISIVCPIEQVVPTISKTIDISVSTDDVSYTDYVDMPSVFVSNFRYVKIRIAFEGSDNHALGIAGPVRLRMSLKKKRDAGNGTSLASGPTVVTLNKFFYSIHSITVSPAYNASYALQAVYATDGAPLPTTFDVYVYRTDTGAQVANDFSWSVEGV